MWYELLEVEQHPARYHHVVIDEVDECGGGTHTRHQYLAALIQSHMLAITKTNIG